MSEKPISPLRPAVLALRKAVQLLKPDRQYGADSGSSQVDPDRTKRQLIWLLVPMERMSVRQWVGVS